MKYDLTIEQLESTLRAGLQKAKERKAKIQVGGFGDGKKSCCAITSVAAWRSRKESHDEFVTRCRETLGITHDEMWDIAYGFDGVMQDRSKLETWQLGAKLRKEFAP